MAQCKMYRPRDVLFLVLLTGFVIVIELPFKSTSVQAEINGSGREREREREQKVTSPIQNENEKQFDKIDNVEVDWPKCILKLKGNKENGNESGIFELQTKYDKNPNQNASFEEQQQKVPKCQISIEQDGNKQFQCFEKGGSENVFRILEDYNAIVLNCTASFPINFDYDGFRPTEAVKTSYWRIADSSSETFAPDSNVTMVTQLYGLTIKILSIPSLHEEFQAFLGETIATKTSSQLQLVNGNVSEPIVYSRTAGLTIRGITNQNNNSDYKSSFYFFVEETSMDNKLTFMTNEHTVNAKVINRTQILVPCRLSHFLPPSQVHLKIGKNGKWFDFEIPADSNNSQNVSFNFSGSSFDSRLGFTIPMESIASFLNYDDEMEWEFQCVVTTKRILLTSATYKIDSGLQSSVYGMDTIKLTQDPSKVCVSNEYRRTSNAFLSTLRCTFYESTFAEFYSYGWPIRSAVDLARSREFVLPAFSHLSYFVQKGSKHGADTLTIENENALGIYFCSDGAFFTMFEFVGTSFNSRQSIYGPGKVWESIPYSNVEDERFMILEDADDNKREVYTRESPYNLCCYLGTSVNKIPTAWFLRYKNGTTIKDFNDETPWTGLLKSSCRTFRFTVDVQVLCTSAIWTSDDWKMAKLDIKVVSDSSFSPTYFLFIGSLVVLLLFLLAFLRIFYGNSQMTKVQIHRFLHGDSKSKSDYDSKVETGNESHTQIYRLPYDKSYEIQRQLIQIDESKILGIGEFGIVYEGHMIDLKCPRFNLNFLKCKTKRKLRRKVAIKTCKVDVDIENFVAFLYEIKIMAHLGQHPNVLPLLAACTSSMKQKQAWAVVELCSLGNLKNYLMDHKKVTLAKHGLKSTYVTLTLDRNFVTHNTHERNGLTLSRLLGFARGIANGMKYLAEKKVVHGDLATRNMLITDTFEVKISDFGLSSILSSQLLQNSEYIVKNEGKLPWRWLALESLKQLKFSTKSDVWAFGVVMWEIMSLGDEPYGELYRDFNLEFLQDLSNGRRLSPPTIYQAEIYELMLECWREDPGDRSSFTEIHSRLEDLTHHV